MGDVQPGGQAAIEQLLETPAENLDKEFIERGPRHMCQDRLLFCTEPGPVPPEYLQIVKDPEFRSMMMTRRIGMRLIAADHADARKEADAILELIRQRMSDLERMPGL